jgi:hypothetical protein
LAGIRRRILAVRKTGTFVIHELEEIEAVVMKMLSNNSVSLPLSQDDNLSMFSKERFPTTKAKLDALFGAE